MPSAQPHLASWDRRLLAAALDAALLIVIGVFMYGAVETAQLEREALFLALAVLYAAYQVASTLWPEFSVGRTVAGSAPIRRSSSCSCATTTSSLIRWIPPPILFATS